MYYRSLIAALLAGLFSAQALASGPALSEVLGAANLPSPASAEPLASSTLYDCSGQIAETGVLRKKLVGDPRAKTVMFIDRTVLRANGMDYPVRQMATASGDRYVWEGKGPETSLTISADEGTLTLKGVTFSNCVIVGG
jgi:hypothetical protein